MTLEQMKERVEAVQRQIRELESLSAWPLDLRANGNLNDAWINLDIVRRLIADAVGTALD